MTAGAGDAVPGPQEGLGGDSGPGVGEGAGDTHSGTQGDEWPECLADYPSSRKVALMLSDPDRYWAQARAESRAWAEKYVDEELARMAAERTSERDETRRVQPWWSWRRWLP